MLRLFHWWKCRNPKPHAKIYDAPRRPAQELLRPRTEFEIEGEIEGEIEILFHDGVEFFVVDGCPLANFVSRHFKKSNYDRNRSFGRMKVLMIPLAE